MASALQCAAPAPVPTTAADSADTSDATIETATDASTDTAQPAKSVSSKGSKFRVDVFGALKTSIGDDPGLAVRIVDAKNGSGVAGLDVAVDYIHASMGHGGSKVPAAKEEAGGRYQLTGLVATMAGSWQVTLAFAGDSAVFPVEVE